MRRFHSRRQQVLVIACLCAASLIALAAENPYDKFRNRTYSNRGYLSEQDEVKLGAEVHEQIRKQYRLVSDGALTAYVNALGQRLAARSQRPSIAWRFFVVDDNSINAFATLGGYVYVHTGLLRATDSEAQLASVLGHEIGHIVARHGLENVKRAQKYSLLAGLAGAAAGALGGNAGAVSQLAVNLIAGGALMKHSRDAEREADYLGLYDVQATGYNTGGMVEMFETLRRVSASNPSLLGPIMQSHPPAGERAANTRAEIEARLSGSDRRGTQNTAEFTRVKSRVGSLTSSSRR